MNATPRVLNRILLTIIAVILLCLGAGIIAISISSELQSLFREITGDWLRAFNTFYPSTAMGLGGSWFWLIFAGCSLALLLLMFWWFFSQGGGRTNEFVSSLNGKVNGLVEPETHDADQIKGRVVINASVAEQLLKSALTERNDVVSVSISSYRTRHQPGIKIRILPRKGVCPVALKNDVEQLVSSLDHLIGSQGLVLLSIGAGARARLTKAERVR